MALALEGGGAYEHNGEMKVSLRRNKPGEEGELLNAN